MARAMDIPTPDSIIERLDEIGLTPTEMCTRAGTDYSTWWRFQSGRTTPETRTFQLWLEALEKAEAEHKGTAQACG
jgi:predicted transcriptional regulator